MKTITLRRLDDAEPLIRDMKPFKSKHGAYGHGSPGNIKWDPNFSAERCDRGTAAHLGRGNLPGRYYDSFASAIYIVRSYYTPIAWFATVPHDIEDPIAWIEGEIEGQWIVPDVKYSVTTTDHQKLVEGALNGTFGPWGQRDDGSWGRLVEHGPVPFSKGWGGQIKVPSGTERY